MKTSELIKELREAMKWNGDQEITIMVYGKRFSDIELNAEENDLYVEAYLPNKEEDLFLRQYVILNDDWTK